MILERAIFAIQPGTEQDFELAMEQAKEVVAYARDRGVRVIPELDMPGHAGSWVVGYPDLASGKGPYTIEKQWGVFDPAMDPSRESTTL